THQEIQDGELFKLQDEIPCLTSIAIPRMDEDRDINCYRYRYFYKYFRPKINDFEYVMLTDSRDIIFQRDVSKYPFASETDLFFADEEKLIGDCPINAGWIRDLYGTDILSELKSKTILCSGTTIGV
ncbi:unnamed protein product, partial [marine sediment metagenome]